MSGGHFGLQNVYKISLYKVAKKIKQFLHTPQKITQSFLKMLKDAMMVRFYYNNIAIKHQLQYNPAVTVTILFEILRINFRIPELDKKPTETELFLLQNEK